MMALDWQVLIVAFAAISLQIMTSIKLMFRQICGEEVQYLCARGTIRPVEVFGRSTHLNVQSQAASTYKGSGVNRARKKCAEVLDKTQAPRGDSVP